MSNKVFCKAHLISSGFKLKPDEVQKTKDYWRTRGLEFIHEPHLMNNETKDLLCSESLRVRFEELKKAFESGDTEFVWSLRGGYGAHQLLPLFKDIGFENKKTYMGFSDGTSIHYFMNMHLNWPSLHSPHPNTFHKEMHKADVEVNLQKIFKGQTQEIKFKELKLLNAANSGPIEGKIIGGNMTTLVSLLGTNFYKGASDKILFLEEIEEPAYKVSRHLHHMNQAGFFDNIKALVFGHMIHSNNEQEKLIYNFIKDWSREFEFPVLWGLSVGHNHKENHPLWFLKNTRIHLDERLCLINNI